MSCCINHHARCAEGYCSSVKVYLEDRFRTKPDLPVFRDKQWKQLRDKLKSLFPQRDTSQGAPPSTRRDREALATSCIWIGKPEFAEFWLFLTATHQCSGRGSESSLTKVDGVKVVDATDGMHRHDVLAVDIHRMKKKKGMCLQTLPIYPDRYGALEDFYFSLFHNIVINGSDHEHLLPLFAQCAQKKNKKGQTISDVSRAHAKCFKEALDVSADEINEELTSHSNRKGSSQRMAETPGLGLAGIHRTGFSSVSVHTVFDYHFGSITMSHHAGKALSGWTARFGEFTPGGQMPTFDDITTELEPLERFTDVLFADDTAKRWRPKVRELLVMSLSLRYDQFVDVLTANPFQKPLLVEDETWDGLHDTPASVRNNLFLCRIHQALEKADVQDCLPNIQGRGPWWHQITHFWAFWVQICPKNAPLGCCSATKIECQCTKHPSNISRIG